MGVSREMSRRAVFLDRDGVINRAVVRNGKPYPPSSVLELEILPGVGDALNRLESAGFDLIVVTNQPDIARGTTTSAAVDDINRKLAESLPLREFRICPHDADDQCDCRKPKPGLLLQASGELGIDLSSSFMVGDRWRDVEAGRRAGCRTLFIDYGYDEQQPDAYDYRVTSLSDAADVILAVEQHGS
jgi:D-glycero-D-manno-heptose 1,7-bisphosphate phosphatase